MAGARKKISLPLALSLIRVGSLSVSLAAPILLLLPRVEERREDLWCSAKARPAVLVDVGVPSSPLFPLSSPLWFRLPPRVPYVVRVLILFAVIKVHGLCVTALRR